MLESKFQGELIQELRVLFPGCIILKNDPNYLQGILDLTILFRDRWALLEVKASERAPRRPNQAYYVEILNNMSYAAFVYPTNKQEVLRALQATFEA
jgi:hypothetical protein